MKTMDYASLALMPDGTIFEYEFGPAHHTPGLIRKMATTEADDSDPDDMGPGIVILNLSYLVQEKAGINAAFREFLSEDEAEHYEFRVYEPADVDRLVGLLRGEA